MAGLAVDSYSDLRHIIGLHLVHYWMVIYRMAAAVLEWQSWHPSEVRFRQLDLAFKNGH